MSPAASHRRQPEACCARHKPCGGLQLRCIQHQGHCWQGQHRRSRPAGQARRRCSQARAGRCELQLQTGIGRAVEGPATHTAAAVAGACGRCDVCYAAGELHQGVLQGMLALLVLRGCVCMHDGWRVELNVQLSLFYQHTCTKTNCRRRGRLRLWFSSLSAAMVT
jgi:hypothetical protein